MNISDTSHMCVCCQPPLLNEFNLWYLTVSFALQVALFQPRFEIRGAETYDVSRFPYNQHLVQLSRQPRNFSRFRIVRSRRRR